MAQVTIISAKDRSNEIVRTAAYARVSSDSEDQLNSFNAQIRYYTEMLQNSDNAVFVDLYAGEGISGTSSAKRKDFQRLMNDCRKGKIDRVLTKSLSRFARNTVDSLNHIRELKALGIAVIFEKENINTLTAESEMLTTIMSCFAQAESESISKNVAWGIRQSFKNGNVPMRYGSMLGYRKGADGKPEIVPEEAEIVREIYRSYLDGKSLVQIANTLNSRGITTKLGGAAWKSANIQSILKNKKYIGDAFLQKDFHYRLHHKKEPKKQRRASDVSGEKPS